MGNSIFKELKEIIINRKYSNIGYLPRWIIFVIDVFIVAVACIVTHVIINSLNVKFNPVVPFVYRYSGVVIVNAVCFYYFRTYAGIIRHSTFIDGVKLLTATSTSFIFLVFFNYTVQNFSNKKVFLSTALFLTFVISFLLLFLFRILVKNIFEKYLRVGDQKNLIKAVIYGADANAISVANALKTESPARFNLIAFIDKYQQAKTSKSILNLPIVNQSKNVHVIMRSLHAEALIIAEKSLSKEETIALVEECLEYNFKVYTVPLITDWEDNKQISNQIKSFDIEDLLHRKPIVLDNKTISSQIKNKVVLISGGAGSIGSEIVRQLINFLPEEIIILDQAESALNSLKLEIESKAKTIKVRTIIADIKDKVIIEKIFEKYRPDFVYHAAAYKHVPLMEENPAQAVFTNVMGTKNVADLARKFKAEKFVLISTDKAVNPSSVMGASKRIAEIYVQSLNQHLAFGNNKISTKYITTRFGNVLGSNGSIVPLFEKQIQEGGPLTITHPEIIRYFMTIPEACQLVLEAGAMGKGGEIFIFDMGEPVKIIDLAKKMIRLAGYIPDKDIQIKVIGLRPGEKLYEELLNDSTKTLPTHNTQIMIAQDTIPNFEEVSKHIQELIENANNVSNNDLVALMKNIVPEYKSMNSDFQVLDIQQ
ncbi:polysaccharide biosynthesis protein [Flavobacterium capsici]|uniref:Nucleoside-diphosphate sugar epimerase/dehydratase n=1 Tax=Flavobacterium capsici TaxID=3075618 RepID=A0AA96JAK1_9FLAO|nr:MULTISPECIES: nucleoside-diphosphate sugar epimerase/dehydratase [unclassified Flavobacterium]WNM20239.1 nucleoside-diphosphate sugar epimerase/dehydratase [Flavobacterium sp. PMR2A8]WNM21629.1 nucleoside-diphosphate sugar epimerase/dehydratase [Flavobacterium sp. PMTSA4]